MQSLDDLLYHAGQEYPGGASALAHRMDRRPQVVCHKLNPNDRDNFLTTRELEMVGDFCNINQALADYFAAKADCITVPLPDESHALSDMELLSLHIDAIASFGDMAREFLHAALDGRITQSENNDVQKAGRAALTALAGFLLRVESMVR